jgi:K+-transporting ATPase KdpF subunit
MVVSSTDSGSGSLAERIQKWTGFTWQLCWGVSARHGRFYFSWIDSQRAEMSAIYLIGGFLAVGLLGYLLVALLKPEWFA